MPEKRTYCLPARLMTLKTSLMRGLEKWTWFAASSRRHGAANRTPHWSEFAPSPLLIKKEFLQSDDEDGASMRIQRSTSASSGSASSGSAGVHSFSGCKDKPDVSASHNPR